MFDNHTFTNRSAAPSEVEAWARLEAKSQTMEPDLIIGVQQNVESPPLQRGVFMRMLRMLLPAVETVEAFHQLR